MRAAARMRRRLNSAANTELA